jgi:acyl-CoA synthetase (AMP-forming)/AMP-acid ligase II
MNLASILLSHATGRPDYPAIVAGRQTLGHADAARRMAAYAGVLARHGVAAGDRVGLALADTPDHLLLHYAVAWLGATIVPIDCRWRPPEKTAVARAFDCRCVIVEPGDPAAAELAALPFDPAWAASAPPSAPPVDDETRPVVLSLSSGTTGRPSGSLVSHRELYERWVGQWAGMGFNGDDRFLLATPLYFGAGRSFAMSFVAAGGTVIFQPPPATPHDLIATAAEHKATILFLVPTQIRRLLEAWDRPGLALPTVRRLVTSGAAIEPQERRQVIERLTPGLVDYYGTSEGGGISVLAPHEQLQFPQTVGRPAFRVEIEIVDDAGGPLPAGEAGRLRYRGPGVSRRHVSGDGVLVTGDSDGWMYPGDLARLLPSGHVQLVGRIKDIIIRAGVNLYPAEIETVLSTHPGIAEVCVCGVPHAELGEAVAAAVVLRPGHHLDGAAVQAYARERLAAYKVPERVLISSDLPRNSSGKVVRAELKARFAG